MKRIWFLLIILFAVIIVFVYLTLPHILVNIYKYSLYYFDDQYKKPVAREIQPSGEELPVSVESFGVSFGIPWTDAEISTSTTRYVDIKKDDKEIKFDRHGLINFYDMSTGAIRRFQSLISNSRFAKFLNRYISPKLKTDYVGEEDLAGYDLLKKIFFSSPRDISFFSKQKDSIENLKLVLLKLPNMAVGQNYYSFKAGEVKGFQTGRAGSGEEVLIYFFDKDDRWFSIRFSNMGQEEIDLILNSVKIVDYNN